MNTCSLLGLMLCAAQSGALACPCIVSSSACQETLTSNLVFIGTVEDIQPALLNTRKPGTRRDWINEPELLKLKADKSPAGVRRLRERYLALLPDLPPEERLLLLSAHTAEGLQTAMTWIRTQGTQITFQVIKMIQHKQDEDDDAYQSDEKKKEKDDKHTVERKQIRLWNESGDCAVPFEKGETYLVYANDDEEEDRLDTNICRRTARISDAGDDLAYLFFLENTRPQSNRLEGFITSEIQHLQLDPFHYHERVEAPISNVIVELAAQSGNRYTSSDDGGRFVFDGLKEGDYSVSIYESASPNRLKRLAGPERIKVQAGKCAMTTMLVLTRDKKE